MIEEQFVDRHIGPSSGDQAAMLAELGFESLDALTVAAVPTTIRDGAVLDLEPASEREALAELRAIAGGNRVLTSLIGLGYHDTVTPPVIRRNVLENPAWYTAYTPYQPEISQGRLEALVNFQTMVSDLTGMEITNASMLDESTAAAEAMTLLHRTAARGAGDVFVVDPDCHPQTIEVVRTRAEPLGIEVVVTDPDAVSLPAGAFGMLVQYPGSSGRIRDLRPIIERANASGTRVAVAADLLALTLLVPPGEAGADVVVGSAQRFGVPLGFGGPHAGYLATRDELRRSLPGRLVGVSVDTEGRTAYRLTLQTREQHIRREKATSNICTAQVLLAVIAGLYGAYHGPGGLRSIASRVHGLAARLAAALTADHVEVLHDAFFDTLSVRVPGRAGTVVASARDRDINLRLIDSDTVGIALDETSTPEILGSVLQAFGGDPARLGEVAPIGELPGIPEDLVRTTTFMTHPVFSAHHSEHQMLRYLRTLSDRDLALDRTMIPLGSCTMKLNATAEMEPITWPQWAGIHPFAPLDQVAGYLRLFADLEAWLAEITGYDAVSLQPNAGSQGEYAGLLAIRAYHRSRGDIDRDVCLIPASAHGTNAASAAMAGMKVIVIACDGDGNVDLVDLKRATVEHGERLAALMVTYPST
ncbi:MAG: aminomethyl-transferring glycine dehydrogenase, partial [Actinomycetota bacterium]